MRVVFLLCREAGSVCPVKSDEIHTCSCDYPDTLVNVTSVEIDYCERSVIVTGDFNVNFSLVEIKTLLTSLKEKFELRTINGRQIL